jgi:hypothetical protein
VILAWLDEAPKEAKKAIEEVLEVEGEEADEELPFAALEREERAKERKERAVAPADVKKDKKACPEGKERSPISGQCVKKCEPNEVRSEKGHCKKVRGAPAVAPAAPEAPAVEPKPKLPTPPMQPEPGMGFQVEEVSQCPAPMEVSSRSGKCVLPCKEEQLRNPSTGHCIKVGELPDENIAKYDIKRCAKSKGQSAAFPFKKEDVLDALKEQGIKARKSWHMEELCSHVTKETLRILERRRTRKNRNKSPEAPAVAPVEIPEAEVPEDLSVVAPEPEAEPAEPVAAVGSPDPNMSNIDIGLCPKGQSMRFPFKREELLDSLREDKVYLARSSTLAKICPHITQETLRRILKRRGNTRKNVRSN